MNKPTKVRRIYAELKSVYGKEMPAHEILECATLIADASADSIRPTRNFVHQGHTPFSELPVDEVIEHWSWQVVSQEFVSEDDFGPDIPEEFLLQQAISIAA